MMTDANTYETQRQKQLSRRRRIISNNDGGDAVKLPEKPLQSPEDFLRIRTTPLKDTHVDTVSYCSGIFGSCRHNTRVGHIYPHYESNVVEDLIERGTDPLEVMVNYCHDNDIEVFCSMRMNDTHDASRPERFRANTFKADNRDCLLGTEKDRPKYGGWSAVNYGCEPVRDMVLRFVEEVCRGYDIDGIELDFFRHPVFFKQTSQGLPVGDDERECMTGLMRKIQTLIREIGMGRGRPFMVAVRAPDDMGYCNTIGLEIERWMEEGLIDIFIPSAYIRLNSWGYSVRLGHRYGVRVYPGLSESRVGGGHHADPLRSSDECYRARALNAWQAGADGVYIFNLFDPHRRIWSEVGVPEILQHLDKLYFASNRGIGRVAGGAYPHEHFIRIPTVNPGAPIKVNKGKRQLLRIQLAEKLQKNQEKSPPEFKLCLKIEPVERKERNLAVVFNGHALQCGGISGDNWRQYKLDPSWLREGENTVELWSKNGKEVKLLDLLISCNHSGHLLEDDSYLKRTRKNM